MKSRLPLVTVLASETLDLLEHGPLTSRKMRAMLAPRHGLDPISPEWPRFVNRHAWALVRLQQGNLIRKVSSGTYKLTGSRPALRTRSPETPPISPSEPLPSWAKRMISTVNRRNRLRWNGEQLSEADLRELWQKCGGRCAITGLPFLETQVGSGRAKRAYAPSLDRVDPDLPYSRDNCRLVRACVNFALNAFGDEVFFEMAEAALEHQRRS